MLLAVLVDGEMWRFENVHPLYHGNPSYHGDPTRPGKNHQRFVNVQTGAVTPAFGSGYALGSAFVDEDTGIVYAFGTHCGDNDACGAATSNRHIRVWWSSDKMQVTASLRLGFSNCKTRYEHEKACAFGHATNSHVFVPGFTVATFGNLTLSG